MPSREVLARLSDCCPGGGDTGAGSWLRDTKQRAAIGGSLGQETHRGDYCSGVPGSA